MAIYEYTVEWCDFSGGYWCEKFASKKEAMKRAEELGFKDYEPNSYVVGHAESEKEEN